MKALGQFEVWLVTGSQQLYGDTVLGRVAEHSREVAESLNDADVVPVRVVHKPVVTSADSIRRLCMEANADSGLRRRDRLDAHVLPGEDVDRRSCRAAEAAPPPPHPVQPRASLGRDRHGLHEPEPVGARRPRVRVHRDPDAAEAQDSRRALADPSVVDRIGTWSRAAAAGTRRRRSKSPASATTCATSQ